MANLDQYLANLDDEIRQARDRIEACYINDFSEEEKQAAFNHHRQLCWEQEIARRRYASEDDRQKGKA